ncbi:MAG: prolipoprotein diacylglyceryl transferase [Clostridiales bacterium]|nr:prolipoprotein diacylglyceryl transferase [Clostridiales bacterium]MDD7386537.1 prolipoprotein diacylglyceryl transferase [Bacillota bacterium]MDY6041810.1 prolipoprotein diacylglyceryl transferase [Candidatus Faecousia sp.]
MYTEISFPSLGITMNPPSSFTIGPLTIHLYGVIIAAGLMLAVLYACRRSREFGIKEDDVIDGVLWVTPFAIICARLYYCLFSWDSYADDPISILYIWNGGLAIYGGVIGAAIGVIVFCKIKKIKIPALLDLVALGFLIGQAMGRWGNFFNREAFGCRTDSFFRMGLLNSITGTVSYFHPTFLYESVWNVIGFVMLHFASKHRQYDGQIALGYAAWYGLGRTFIEGLRTDSLYLGVFRVSQLLAAVTCFAALVVLVWQMFRPHDPARLLVNQTARREQETPKSTEE